MRLEGLDPPNTHFTPRAGTDGSGRTVDGAFHVEDAVLDGFREIQNSTSRTVQRVYHDLRSAPKCIVIEFEDVPEGSRGVTYESSFLGLRVPHFFECNLHPLYIDISPEAARGIRTAAATC